MNEYAKMIKQLEFRKQTEEAKFEAFSLMCKKVANLEKENKLLGERCNQLLKDKGNLIDELQELKETLAHTIENDEVSYETLKLHDQEEIGMLNSRVAELEQQIEEMKCPWNCKHFSNCKYSNCPCDEWKMGDKRK